MANALDRCVGGAVASWLVRSTPKRAIWVWALAGGIVHCSWARHYTLTMPLSTQVYKWVPVDLMLGVTLQWTSIPSRGEFKYSQSLHATETRISFGLVGHIGPYADFTLPYWTGNSLWFLLCGIASIFAIKVFNWVPVLNFQHFGTMPHWFWNPRLPAIPLVLETSWTQPRKSLITTGKMRWPL